MTVVSLPKRLRIAIVTLCLALVAVTGIAVPVQSAPATGLRFDPDTALVSNGDTLKLALWVDDVADLYRVELHMNYDWAGLEVLDADPGRVSVQIEPGPLFCPACTPWNEAVSGEIHFVAQRDPADGPFSGSGIAAFITLLITATQPDTYTVSFDRAATRLLDSGGRSIIAGRFTDAALVLSPPLARLTGWLTREGVGSDERSVVNAILYPATSPYQPSSWGRTCTDASGDFTLEIRPNPQPPPADILPSGSPPTSPPCASQWAFLRLDFTNYLSECYWECTGDGVRNIGWHDLEGGDVNGDGCINILDIVSIIGEYGTIVAGPCTVPCAACPPDSPSSNVAPARDVNGDCQVNILDLTQAAGNFGLCSNCP